MSYDGQLLFSLTTKLELNSIDNVNKNAYNIFKNTKKERDL